MTPEAAIADAIIEYGKQFHSSPVIEIVDSDASNYKPSLDVEYIAFKLFINSTNTLFVGTDSTYQCQGIFQMTVAYPLKAGVIQAIEFAGQIAQYFKKGTTIKSGGVKIKIDRQPSIATPQQDGAWLRVPVSIPYNCMVRQTEPIVTPPPDPEPDTRVWQTLFQWDPRIADSASAANFAGLQVRIQVDDIFFPATTTKLRLTFAGAVDLADQTAHGFAATVGRQSFSGDAYDFASAPTPVLFSGVGTTDLPSALPDTADYPLIVSDEIALTLNGGQGLVIAFTCTDGQSGSEDATGVEAVDNFHMYIDAAGNDINAVNPGGLIAAGPTFGNNYLWALYKLEVYA